MILTAYILGGAWIFALGAVVGSFANVCIYRVPNQMSVIWPGSHCPRCLTAIKARDNVPILGWLALRGRCRSCGGRIAARYPGIEALCGSLFLAIFLADFVLGPKGRSTIPSLETEDFVRLASHLVLASLLLIATFIDYDTYTIPDAITLPGMALGLLFGAIVPGCRPDPGHAITAWEGLKVGGIGLMVGGGTIWVIRILGGLIFRKEAMGFGDVTLVAMIGAFLGWQVVPATLFLGAVLGLAHAFLKGLNALRKILSKTKLAAGDHEIPFGPYLSMAALILMVGWPWAWPPLAEFYRNLAEASLFLTGQGP